MRKSALFPFFCLVMLFAASCTKDGASSGIGVDSGGTGSGSSGSSGGGGNPGGTPGVVTAGEWNDIANWNFWNTQLQRDTIKEFPAKWGFYTTNKVSVLLRGADGKLLHDASVTLTSNGNTITGRTDNFGKAELTAGIFTPGFSLQQYTLTAGYNRQTFNLGTYPASQNSVEGTLPVNKAAYNILDIMFVVDATGSMGDEISYLKTELYDVISRAGSALPGRQIRMGSVFYRDIGDEYVTRPFAFTTSKDQLRNFLSAQSANGGGDFPEAVDEALKTAVQEQQWSSNAVNRLIFLILDAPPHDTQNELTRLREAVKQAQQKGIRIIPVTASGIDWQTEFLMRFLAVSANSTYVFITNHSGIGNPHFTPTVGNYTVEYLNNLMVRLITKYGTDND